MHACMTLSHSNRWELVIAIYVSVNIYLGLAINSSLLAHQVGDRFNENCWIDFVKFKKESDLCILNTQLHLRDLTTPSFGNVAKTIPIWSDYGRIIKIEKHNFICIMHIWIFCSYAPISSSIASLTYNSYL